MKIVLMESLGISDPELRRHTDKLKAQGHDFAAYSKTTDVSALIAEAQDADAMILANMPMPAEVLAACPQLKFIDIAFTGVDHVAMETAREKKMVVSNASGYSDESVAELGIGLAIDLARNIPQTEARCRAGQTKDGLVGSELKGQTVGIVGLGKIGTRSAELFHAFGCRILSHSRTVHADAPAYVRQVDRGTLLRESDFVVLHCPLTPSTRGMIDRAALALMKPYGYLINLARGPVVVAQDLADALNTGVIAGAAVDVFDREPPLTPDEPLLHAKNTILTPHIAFATRQSMCLRAEIVFENLQAWLNGSPVNLVR